MILAKQGDEEGEAEATQYLEVRAVGTLEGIIWDLKCFSLTTIV